MNPKHPRHAHLSRTTSIIGCGAATVIIALWLGTNNTAYAPVDRSIGRGVRPDHAAALRSSHDLWKKHWQLRQNTALRQLQRRAADIGQTAVNICGPLEARPGVLAEAYAIASELVKLQPMEEPHNRKRLYQRGSRIKDLAERMINPTQFQ